ncbi:Uma2 family endonuclease [uncultured Thiocystis sp.]|jgi:Uma2 family endonuclease|uniref:Uma2 family endonuclease n=1 Tax=uncultured Thiocystis sp. TaxID=1202134 RepID=UPI0025D75DEC|nr:Uma2 family endonuclease [uncultured Thiocystis sp.]
MNPLSRIDPDDPYPESDGQPMADNTEQYEWIVRIKENLEILFADRADVFIAGDLLWYPVPDRQIVGPIAPDVLVAFGRPKGKRGCYKQWEEDGIAPQVVFEILSPSNSRKEMADKRDYYELYGVEEYYLYDPDRNRLEIWRREDGRLLSVSHLNGWVSPRLGIRFALRPETLELFDPHGRPFMTSVELARHAEQAWARADQEQARAEQEQARADQERTRADQERARADQASQRAERLAERLRALGIDPETLDPDTHQH